MIPVDHFFKMNNGYKFISGCSMHPGYIDGYNDKHQQSTLLQLDGIPTEPCYRYKYSDEETKRYYERSR